VNLEAETAQQCDLRGPVYPVWISLSILRHILLGTNARDSSNIEAELTSSAMRQEPSASALLSVHDVSEVTVEADDSSSEWDGETFPSSMAVMDDKDTCKTSSIILCHDAHVSVPCPPPRPPVPTVFLPLRNPQALALSAHDTFTSLWSPMLASATHIPAPPLTQPPTRPHSSPAMRRPFTCETLSSLIDALAVAATYEEGGAESSRWQEAQTARSTCVKASSTKQSSTTRPLSARSEPAKPTDRTIRVHPTINTIHTRYSAWGGGGGHRVRFLRSTSRIPAPPRLSPSQKAFIERKGVPQRELMVVGGPLKQLNGA
jgi:hypothetical protein